MSCTASQDTLAYPNVKNPIHLVRAKRRRSPPRMGQGQRVLPAHQLQSPLHGGTGARTSLPQAGVAFNFPLLDGEHAGRSARVKRPSTGRAAKRLDWIVGGNHSLTKSGRLVASSRTRIRKVSCVPPEVN